MESQDFVLTWRGQHESSLLGRIVRHCDIIEAINTAGESEQETQRKTNRTGWVKAGRRLHVNFQCR